MRANFRRVVDSEIDDAYGIYREVFDWLRGKGVRQWLRPLSREVFAKHQRSGELFAYHVHNSPAAVVTLAFEKNSHWSEKIGEGRHWWISALAVSRAYRGAEVGTRVMRQSEALMQSAGASEAFLDCVDAGFLPGYYIRLGYEEFGRKDIRYPSGNTYPMVLMKKSLLNNPADLAASHL
jgi:ribosomal protein S18 acetylase RimI-like enzyme